MSTDPISDTKTKLAAMVRAVEASGEGYVSSINGHPMAELLPYVPVPTPGRFRETIRFGEDAFAPLTDTEVDNWHM